MHKLVITEKPSVAMSTAAALGVKGRKDGCIEGGGWLISWCMGHLAELSDASAYDPRYGVVAAKRFLFNDPPNLGKVEEYPKKEDVE